MKINSKCYDLSQAFKHEGEVLVYLVTKTRDQNAVLNLLKKAMARRGQPEVILIDKPRLYGATTKVLGARFDQEMGRAVNMRAENSHLPFLRHGRIMQRFRRMRSLQKFLPSTSSDRSISTGLAILRSETKSTRQRGPTHD